MNDSTMRTRGFTLIELLVVIAIITLLVGIMLPSLGRARESAKQVVCRANLRNIWTGVTLYATDNAELVPFMENINLTDPDADPFDPKIETTVGTVLTTYVNQGSWKCPGAIDGYPRNAGPGNWKMTYWFRSAGPVGEGVPFDEVKGFRSGSLDPLVSNYINFDGRPFKFISGRRHTPSNRRAPNHDSIGPWTVSFPIVADLITGSDALGTPRYPHIGQVQRRDDLKAGRETFEKNAGTGRLPARMEIHAEGDKQMKVYLTRVPFKHKPGY